MNCDESKTILIVEDEAIISIVTSKSVKRFGYNVICANSGERAVELAAENEAISLILMDIELGTGIDGTEAAQRILAIRDIPIVFHTSHSEREMVERVRGITRYGYVIKSSGDFVLQSSIEMAYELVEAKKKVKASEEHFYGLFEKAPLGYQSLDENGYFLEVNKSWLDTLGYSREEVVGKWFGDFLAPEFTDAFRERFPMFKAAGKIHSEFQMMHKNGERRYIAFEGRIGYRDDGSFMQTHCILSDITESKRAEEQLIRNEARFRSYFELSTAGIALTSPAAGWIEVNDRLCEMLGYSRDELTMMTWTELTHPDDLNTDLEQFRQVMAGEIEAYSLDKRFIRKDGECIWTRLSVKCVRLADGSVDYFSALLIDITERKIAEQEIQVKNEEMFALNEELNATIEEMEAANEELSAANERLIESEREIERSEEKFRQMFFQHQAVMLLIDPESGYIIDANSSAEAFYGYDLGDFRRMRIQDINTISQEEIKAEMQRAKDRQRNYFIFSHRLANSEIRTVEVYSSPVTINMNTLLFSIIHDITDRINAQKALIVKDWAIESAINPIAISDLDGRLSYVNTAFQKFWGFSSAAEVLGRPVTEFWQFGEKAAEVVEKLHSHGGWSGELTAMRNDGFYFDVQVAASMVIDSESRPVCMLASFAEITDRKKAEEELRASEEQFKSLAESSKDYIMVYDKDKRHIYANKATLEVSGKTWDEYIGKTHREMGFDPEQCRIWEEKIQKVFDTGEAQGEVFEWEGPEGHIFLDWRVMPIFSSDGTVVNVLGVSRDITNIKQIEEKLRESEERYSVALSAVDDGIWEWNVMGGKGYLSPQYYNMLGYPDGGFAASYDIWRKLVHPEDIDRVEQSLKFNADRGEKFNIDFRMKMKSGEWLWVCTRGKAVEWNAEGKAVRMVGTLSDVTLRKNAEMELRNSLDTLEKIIQNSSELICEVDDMGRYTFVSERYIEILGYSPDELLGMPVSDKMHPDDLEKALAKYEHLKSATGISVDEWRFMHKNGTYRTFECRGSAYINSEGHLRTVVISHDITESKKIEDAQMFLIVSGSPLSGGEGFFQSLARYLAENLGVDFVCIDRLVGNGLSAKTLAVFFDGEFEDNVEYTLKDTPCGAVAGKTVCTFKEKVRELFPGDVVLQEMGAESYAGVTLWSSTGDPIGLIAVIARKKMENIHIAESVLKMVAVRAAGELERRDAEEKIRNLLQEKELLLKEVHHRIKNNMSTINGILALQADALKDGAAATALNDAIARVQSMMVLYDKLYRSDDFKEVSVNEYLPALITEIMRNFPDSIKVKTEMHIDDFTLEAKTLVPLGIIVNELLTNIMKYAFKGKESGLISVTASCKENRSFVMIKDNGIGIPENVDFSNSTGFGMQLVGMLTEQIDGSIRIERGDGTRFILEFEV